jgi:hypothetical protein
LSRISLVAISLWIAIAIRIILEVFVILRSLTTISIWIAIVVGIIMRGFVSVRSWCSSEPRALRKPKTISLRPARSMRRRTKLTVELGTGRRAGLSSKLRSKLRFELRRSKLRRSKLRRSKLGSRTRTRARRTSTRTRVMVNCQSEYQSEDRN